MRMRMAGHSVPGVARKNSLRHFVHPYQNFYIGFKSDAKFGHYFRPSRLWNALVLKRSKISKIYNMQRGSVHNCSKYTDLETLPNPPLILQGVSNSTKFGLLGPYFRNEATYQISPNLV